MILHWVRRVLLRASIPLQKWLQKIHRPEFKIHDQFYFDLKSKIRNGDVLLSREDWHLTNPMIPGYWKHAAIYTNGWVIEAIGEGVVKTSFERWCFSKDYIACYRPKFLDQVECSQAGILAAQQVGKPYDFEFAEGGKAFYCSELVYWAYSEINHAIPFTLRESMGVRTVIPSDFANAKIKFRLVKESVKAG